MLLWILFAAMTAAVLAAVLAPLARAGGGGDQRRAGSLAVYRDQLEELESDRAGGLIDADEAAATKIEISRRLLAGAAASGPRQATGVGRPHGTAASPSPPRRCCRPSSSVSISFAARRACPPSRPRPGISWASSRPALLSLWRAWRHACVSTPQRARVGKPWRRSISSSDAIAKRPMPMRERRNSTGNR